tara:strand:+ start:1554 stop:1802 length:249 start_codon:yes stop_codon:yes gene_type:complete
MPSLKRLDYGDNWEEFVLKLKAKRESLELSQEALDHKLGVTKGVVWKWENARRRPSSYLLSCWVTSLDMRLDVKDNDEEEAA